MDPASKESVGRTTKATRRGHAWLQERGLMPLAAGAALGALATLLFLLGGIGRAACDKACADWALMPAALVETLGFTAFLIACAATGHWIGGATQRTWLERLQLQRELLALEKTVDPARARRLAALLAPDSAIAAIQERGRRHFWASLPIVLIAVPLLPSFGNRFLEPANFAAYLLPFLVLASLVGVAALVRGMTLTISGRRMMRPNGAEATLASTSKA